jgi:hypothetical protein
VKQEKKANALVPFSLFVFQPVLHNFRHWVGGEGGGGLFFFCRSFRRSFQNKIRGIATEKDEEILRLSPTC